MDRDEDRATLSRYVRERLQREAKEHGRGYQADMARRTGLSQAHIANVMNRDYQGVGIDAAAAFGRAWGMSVSEMLDASHDATPRSGRKGPDLPNLEAAIAFLRGRGAVSDAAVVAARRIAAASRDFSVATWIVVLSDLVAGELPAPTSAARRP